MTDLTIPAENGAAIEPAVAAAAWEYAGVGSWVVDGEEDSYADLYTSLDSSGLNAFDYVGSDGLTATLEGGEALVGGWLARDEQTEIDLPADSDTTIYVGIDTDAILAEGEAPGDSQNIIVGPASDFESTHPRVAIWTLYTDGDSVTDQSDHRRTSPPVEYNPVDDELDIGPDVALSRARLSHVPGDPNDVTRKSDLDSVESSLESDIEDLDAEKVASDDVDDIYVGSEGPEGDDPYLLFIPED